MANRVTRSFAGRGAATFQSLLEAMDGAEGQTFNVDLSDINARQSLRLGYFELFSNALVADADTPFAAFAELVDKLKPLAHGIQWWLGDLLCECERIHGETYAQLSDMTSLKEQTLYDYLYVASHIEISIRNENLSWSHHRLVAKFAPHEQAYWLDRALAEHLSVQDLRQAIYPPPIPTEAHPPTLPERIDLYLGNLARKAETELGLARAMAQGQRETLAKYHEDMADTIRRL